MLANCARILVIMAVIIGLTACQSSVKQMAKPAVFNHLDSNEQQTIETVNQQLSGYLLSADHNSLSQMVSVQLAPEKMAMGVHEYNLDNFTADENVKQLNHQVVLDLVLISGIGQLNYLYSEPHNKQVWASHYQVVGDTLIDFTIYIDKQSLRVIDWQQFPFHSSFMRLMVEVDDLMFDLYDEAKYFEVMTYSNFIEVLSQYGVGQKTHVDLIEAFERLPDSLKKHWLVGESISRTVGSVERDSNARKQVDEMLARFHPQALYLNWYYMQTQNYGQIIENILAVKSQWIRGSVLQQELVKVLLLDERYDQAIVQAQDLLTQLPDEKMSHLILLRVSLQAERHHLTTKTLMAIKNKFNFNVTSRWLRAMNKGNVYVASDEFVRFNQLKQ